MLLMSKQTTAWHHFTIRKRVYQKHEPYPHPDKFKRFFDKIIYLVGIVGPVMTIPQLMKIWIDKNAQGVSAISWMAYLLTAICWMAYGIIHKEKPIILTYVFWIILDILVVVGTLIYG